MENAVIINKIHGMTFWFSIFEEKRELLDSDNFNKNNKVN